MLFHSSWFLTLSISGQMKDNLKRSIPGHALFWLTTLLVSVATIYLGLSPNGPGMAIFTFAIVITNVYTGRWISKQALKGKPLDLFRMAFLSFFFLSLAGALTFIRYVEPEQHFLHYLETWINVSVISALCLLSGFFVTKALRKRFSAVSKH